MLIYVLSVLTTFTLSLAKAFQVRTIVSGNKRLAFFVSWFITSCEVATVSYVVLGGWTVLFTAGIGGSVGVVTAMALHDRIIPKKEVKNVAVQ